MSCAALRLSQTPPGVVDHDRASTRVVHDEGLAARIAVLVGPLDLDRARGDELHGYRVRQCRDVTHAVDWQDAQGGRSRRAVVRNRQVVEHLVDDALAGVSEPRPKRPRCHMGVRQQIGPQAEAEAHKLP
jgi:hypothetical protein